jgi:hypothetical protein
MRQIIECAAGTLQDAVCPAPDIICSNWFRSESDDVITACKRELQLGDTPPDLVHPPQIGDLLIAVSRGFGREEALFLHETVKIGARHCPGVTLILHETVHDGDRAASSILLQFDSSQKGRGVRERDHFGEKVTNFDFRIDGEASARPPNSAAGIAANSGAIKRSRRLAKRLSIMSSSFSWTSIKDINLADIDRTLERRSSKLGSNS